MRYDTEVLIFINNENIIELIKSQMKNCTVKTIDFDNDMFIMPFLLLDIFQKQSSVHVFFPTFHL